jgi:rhodanese-related sulfurtransferase
LSFRARALRSSLNNAATAAAGASSVVSGFQWNPSSLAVRNNPTTTLPAVVKRGNQKQYAVSTSVLSLGGLVRSRSALDVRQVSPMKRRVEEVQNSTAADAALFNTRLTAFVQAQQQAVEPRTTPTCKRRIEVGLQELSDLVKVSCKGWKMGYEGRRPVLIDVRESDELETHPGLPGSINIPLSVLKASLALPSDCFRDTFLMEKPDLKNPDVVFYGRGPNHSMTALEIAHKSGYKVSRHFPGGITAWESYMNNFGVVDLF